MKKTGYLVWVNDDQFWHSTLGSAQKRSRLAKMRGNDTLIVGFQVQPFLVGRAMTSRAS